MAGKYVGGTDSFFALYMMLNFSYWDDMLIWKGFYAE